MNEEIKKKNNIIYVLVGIIVILLIVGAFFLGQFLGKEDKKKNEPVKNNVKNYNTNILDNKKTNNKPVVAEKDVYEKINDVKNDGSLTNTQKADNILKLVVDYTKINIDISNEYCKFAINTESTDESYYYETGCGGQEIHIDKKMEKIGIDQVGEYSLLKDKKDNIDILKNSISAYDFTSVLENDFKVDDLYEYFNKKYSVEGVCFESTIDGDYFYLNVVSSPKGWYNYNQYTGKCEGKTKDLVTYKFNTKTDKYEVIEK